MKQAKTLVEMWLCAVIFVSINVTANYIPVSNNRVPNTQIGISVSLQECNEYLLINESESCTCQIDYDDDGTVKWSYKTRTKTSTTNKLALDILYTGTPYTQYICTGAQGFMTATHTHTVNFVYGPDKVTLNAPSAPFRLCPSDNSTMEINCYTDGSEVNPGANVTLTGTPGEPMFLFDATTIIDGVLNYVFDFRPQIGGRYNAKCEAVNSKHSAYSAWGLKTIEIYEPPSELTLKLDDAVVPDGGQASALLGEKVVAQCSVKGGYPAVSSVTLVCAGMTVTSLTTEARLEFSMPKITISCLCSYQHASGCSNAPSSFKIDALYEPRITNVSIQSKSDKVIVVDQGEAIPIECQAEGNPRPEVSIRKGQRLQDGGATVDVGDYGQRLSMTKVMRCQDSNYYRCLARNKIGQAVETQQLIWVKCNAEFVHVQKGTSGWILKFIFKIYIYPDPTQYRLYKFHKGQSDVEDFKELVNSNDYSTSFTRIGIQSGYIELNVVDNYDDQVTFYSLTVLNGLDDVGSEIEFNVTTNDIFISRPPSNSRNWVALITCIIIGILAVATVGISICFFSQINKSGCQC